MNTNPTTITQVDAGYETSKFALGVGAVIAALVGLWGAICLFSALVDNGPTELVKAYVSTVVGM